MTTLSENLIAALVTTALDGYTLMWVDVNFDTYNTLKKEFEEVHSAAGPCLLVHNVRVFAWSYPSGPTEARIVFRDEGKKKELTYDLG